MRRIKKFKKKTEAITFFLEYTQRVRQGSLLLVDPDSTAIGVFHLPNNRRHNGRVAREDADGQDPPFRVSVSVPLHDDRQRGFFPIEPGT